MANSHWGKLLLSVQQAVIDRALTNLADANVLLLEIPWDVADRVTSLPAVIVSPIGAESIPPTDGTVAADDIGKAILIAIIDSKKEILADFDRWDQALLWREQLIDTFINVRLFDDVGGKLCDITTIEPNPVVDPSAWLSREVYLSTFAIRPKNRTRRRV